MPETSKSLLNEDRRICVKTLIRRSFMKPKEKNNLLGEVSVRSPMILIVTQELLDSVAHENVIHLVTGLVVLFQTADDVDVADIGKC